MHDYQIIPLLLKAGILAQPEIITLQTTSAQCIINLVCLTLILITLSRRLLARIVLHFKNRVMLNKEKIALVNRRQIRLVISENRPKRSDSREKGPPTRDGYYNSELRAPDEGDGDFETFFRRRTQRFYLGGFQANFTEETILHYTERRGIMD